MKMKMKMIFISSKIINGIQNINDFFLVIGIVIHKWPDKMWHIVQLEIMTIYHSCKHVHVLVVSYSMQDVMLVCTTYN